MATCHERMAEVYAKASLFAFPTLADEWGVVVNEAMAAGLPVLGSIYSQAVEELVEDGVSGWVFRPMNRRKSTPSWTGCYALGRRTWHAWVPPRERRCGS